MINGAHSIIYSKDPKADRDFFEKILKLPSCDAGNGWLIFGLPPAEVAVHPADDNDRHELYLMCEDIRSFTGAMKQYDIRCSEIEDAGWGLLVRITLPGGGLLGVYQPRHGRPDQVS